MLSFGEFVQFFGVLFGAGVSSAEPASLVLTLGLAEVLAFTAAEVEDTLAHMAPHRSAGLARFSVDLFLACCIRHLGRPSLVAMVLRLYSRCSDLLWFVSSTLANVGYPL